MNWITSPTDLKAYRLLDSGDGQKLEEIAGIRVIRPSVQAIWTKSLPDTEWKKATSVCQRSKDGGGKWIHHKAPPEKINLEGPAFAPLRFRLKFTSFGHCGIFFEQVPVWKWLFDQVTDLKSKLNRPPRVLNLFGYTGAASLIMAKAGAKVFHVDSSKGVLDWAQESMTESGMTDGVQLIHEDVQKFLIKQFNQSQLFDGVLCDPPSWGHGAKKEVWQFDQHIQGLVEKIHQVLKPKDVFFLLSSHTPGIQPEALKNLFFHEKRWKKLMVTDLGVAHAKNDEKVLPAGIACLGLG
jgi:23S rRNA (cytosine1962-C5)-methyltransferase